MSDPSSHQCEYDPTCTSPWEFLDEDDAVYCHAHMVGAHGPCGEDCTGGEDCPSHTAWLEYLAEEKDHA